MKQENEFLKIKPGLVEILLTTTQLEALSNFCYLARFNSEIETNEALTNTAITMGNMFYALASVTSKMNGG